MNDSLAVNNSPTRISKNDCIHIRFTDFSTLYTQLNDECALITPNHRSALMLQEDFNQHQQRILKRNSWSQLNAMPYERLLAVLLHRALDGDRICLSNAQEHCLWMDAVAAAWPSETRPVDPHMAKLAMDAWRIVHEWALPMGSFTVDANQDVGFFVACANAFKRLLEAKGAITSAQSIATICQNTASNHLPHKRLCFYGFDQITPSMQSLINWLSDSYEILWADQEPSSSQHAMRYFSSEQEEIGAMLEWVDESLMRDPKQRLVVVVPELSRLRNMIDRQLRQIPSLPQINVSGGSSLASYPLIQHALWLIELVYHKRLPATAWGALLRSPFLKGSHEEMAERSLLDEKLRACGKTHLSVQQVEKTSQSWRMPVLTHLLDWVATQSLDRSAAPSNWLQQFNAWLQLAGWPGDRTLNSEEHQLHKAFDGVFKSCADLDALYDKLYFNPMLLRLKTMIQSHLFQAESTNASANILGALEAAALPCDRLWVMSCYIGQWPAPPHPHPFIPLHLQKQQGTPHSSHEKTLAFSRQLLARMLAHPEEVIFSMPAEVDGMPQVPSPLVESLATDCFDLTAHPISETTSPPPSGLLDHVVDATITHAAPEKHSYSTALFRDQAHCPFAATAKHRFHATELSTPDPLLSHADLGIVVHDALDSFWSTTKDQANLLKMDASEEDALLQRVIRQAIRRFIPSDTIQPCLQKALAQFTKQLLKAFLASEKMRPPFTVQSCESDIEGDIQGIHFHGIIDRVDQFPDGRYALIDYKTGSINPNEWFNDRLTQPQLPLYAKFHSASFDAIVFAVIQDNGIHCRGLIGLPANWPEVEAISDEDPVKAWRLVKDDWDKKLNQLAAEWLGGHAPVQPALHTSCQYCHLSLLCRIRHE